MKRWTAIVAAAMLAATCAVAAQVSAGQVANPQVITGNSQVDDVLSGRVQRIGFAPGFEIYSEAGQMPARVFEKFRRAMWKVIQRIDPWNLPQTLARWPVRIFYLGRDTLLRLGLQVSGCQDGTVCGQATSREVFLTLIPTLGGNFSTNAAVHEMSHLFLFRVVDHNMEMWSWTEFPGNSPGLIALARWMVGRLNERYGLNPTPPAVSETRFNQILQIAREEVFAGWPEVTFHIPYNVEGPDLLRPGNDGRDEIRAAMYVASVVVRLFNMHEPGTDRAYSAAIAGIVAEVEAECARDGAC